MPTRRPARANARLSGSPTWPPPPRTTTSRSAGVSLMRPTLAAGCEHAPRPEGRAVPGTHDVVDRREDRPVPPDQDGAIRVPVFLPPTGPDQAGREGVLAV